MDAKTNIITMIVAIVLISIGLQSCANKTPFEQTFKNTNKKLAAEFDPLRYYLVESNDKVIIHTQNWAGEFGESITNKSNQLRSDVFGAFKKHCQFSESDLKEIRIVSHNNPVFYEVWVFNDKLSKRKDKTSGWSVVMKQLPNGGGVDFNIIGRCHAEEATTFFEAVN